MYKIITFFLFFSSLLVHSLQLNCTVTVNAQKMDNPNLPVFKTLQSALSDFVNKTNWSAQALQQNEKIDCSIYITLLSGGGDQFSGTIQLQSSRPIFDSSYSTPIFNYNDKDFNFRYVEYENLIYNTNSFDSNLISIISFYCHIILGLDADSFVEQAGTPYFEAAQNIANLAQQGGSSGWLQGSATQNRYFLINDLLSPTYNEVRRTAFQYNTALDGMSKELKTAKEKIKAALLGLNKVHALRPNAFLTRVFFDAKSDEIVSLFSAGPSLPTSDLIDSLNRISAMNATKWNAIKP